MDLTSFLINSHILETDREYFYIVEKYKSEFFLSTELCTIRIEEIGYDLYSLLLKQYFNILMKIEATKITTHDEDGVTVKYDKSLCDTNVLADEDYLKFIQDGEKNSPSGPKLVNALSAMVQVYNAIFGVFEDIQVHKCIMSKNGEYAAVILDHSDMEAEIIKAETLKKDNLEIFNLGCNLDMLDQIYSDMKNSIQTFYIGEHEEEEERGDSVITEFIYDDVNKIEQGHLVKAITLEI